MTQIVDERLKKMCDECHSHLDKPCAWLSLGNEYCTEIMDIQQELQRKDNIINELKNELEQEIATVSTNRAVDYNNPEWWYKTNCYGNILDKIEELENDN